MKSAIHLTARAAAACALLLCSSMWSSLSATNLTGTFKHPDGSAVNGKLIFLLSQPARLSDGSAQVVPMVKIFSVTNGALESGAFVYGNDGLLPAGTYYLVRLVDNNNNLLFEQKWSIQGASLDLGTLTPTTTGVVVPDPLLKNITTDQAVQGPVTFSSPVTAFTLTLNGNLNPGSADVYDLGDTSLPWRQHFVNELHARGVPWFDVKSYGAIGDGSTNDAAAFQSAINACQAAGRGVVYVPPSTGSYKINSALAFTGPVGSGYCEFWQADSIDYSAVTTTTTFGKGWKIWGIGGVYPSFEPGPKQQWIFNSTNPPNPIFRIGGGAVELHNLKLATVRDTTGLIIDTSTGSGGTGGTMVVLDGVEIIAYGDGAGIPLVIKNIQWVYVSNSYFNINPGTNTQPVVWIYSGHGTASDGTTTGLMYFENVVTGKNAIKIGHATLGPGSGAIGHFNFKNLVQEGGAQAVFQLDATNAAISEIALENVEQADPADNTLPLIDDVSSANVFGIGHIQAFVTILGTAQDFYRPPAAFPTRKINNLELQGAAGNYIRDFSGNVQHRFNAANATSMGERRSGFIVEGWNGGLGQTGGVGGALGQPQNVVATPSASGGSCADGTYYFAVTAVSAETAWTAESLPSLEKSCTISGGGGNGKCSLSWDAVSGLAASNGYRVYGTGQMTGIAAQNKPNYVSSSAASKDWTCSGTTGGSPPIYTQHTGQGKSFWLNPLGSSWFMNRVGFGTVSPGTPVDVVGKIRTTTQFESTQATGTPPAVVASTTEIANWNAQLWHGKQSIDFSASLDFGSIAAQSCAELTITATGASANDPVTPSWPVALEAGLVGIMRVSSASTVTVRLCNVTAASIDPAGQTFGGRVVH